MNCWTLSLKKASISSRSVDVTGAITGSVLVPVVDVAYMVMRERVKPIRLNGHAIENACIAAVLIIWRCSVAALLAEGWLASFFFAVFWESIEEIKPPLRR